VAHIPQLSFRKIPKIKFNYKKTWSICQDIFFISAYSRNINMFGCHLLKKTLTPQKYLDKIKNMDYILININLGSVFFMAENLYIR